MNNMNHLKTIVLGIAATLPLLLSCTKTEIGSETGRVSFSLAQDETTVDVTPTKGNVSTFTTLPNLSDFEIDVKNAAGEDYHPQGLGTPLVLHSGSYTAEAVYGSVSEEGFGKPCFKGSQSFSVTGGQDTDVKITVRLANCIIKPEYTAAFKQYFGSYSFTVTTGNGTVIDFPSTETRAAFIDAYQFKLTGSLTNQAGKSVTFPEKEFTSLNPATCYTLKFDVSNVGGMSINITFNSETTNVNLGDIELND